MFVKFKRPWGAQDSDVVVNTAMVTHVEEALPNNRRPVCTISYALVVGDKGTQLKGEVYGTLDEVMALLREG